MIHQLFTVSCLVAAASCFSHKGGVVDHGAARAGAAGHKLTDVQHEEHHYDPHPRYKYEYSVHDSHTGDIKSHKEERDGDVVHGSYSLVEPDGSKRIVHYTADKHTGFNAVVHREPNTHSQKYNHQHKKHGNGNS